jgi:hypothetical protein
MFTALCKSIRYKEVLATLVACGTILYIQVQFAQFSQAFLVRPKFRPVPHLTYIKVRLLFPDGCLTCQSARWTVLLHR